VCGDCYRHEALIYAGDEAFVDRVGGFLRAGVAAGDAMLAVVDAPKIERLVRALGPDADRVEFEDMRQVGKNPGLIINRWLEFVAAQPPGTTMRGVGEPVYAERRAAEREECHLHEALLNVALEPETPLWLVCPYDTTTLTADDLAHARRNHPIVADDDGRETSSVTHERIDPLAGAFADPEYPVHKMGYDVATLSAARRFARDEARLAGVAGARCDEFVLAMSEIASNSVLHGGGQGVVRCWSEPDRFVCEIEDAGRMKEPLVGRVRPIAGRGSGYGLWIAQRMCDLVQVRSDDVRTAVRLHILTP
jgi:anti-sigma regulatory factor (Ser/Thr protein kinase)